MSKAKLKTTLVIFVAFCVLFLPVTGGWGLVFLMNLTLHFLVPIVGVLLLVLIGFLTVSLDSKRFYKKPIVSLFVVMLIMVGALLSENFYRLHKLNPAIQNVQFECHEGHFWDGRAFPDSDVIHIVSMDNPHLNAATKNALLNGMKIVKALRKYYEKNGTYPEKLDFLVPDYLEEIPRPELVRMGGSKDFRYRLHNKGFKLQFSGFFEDFEWYNDENFWWFEND